MQSTSVSRSRAWVLLARDGNLPVNVMEALLVLDGAVVMLDPNGRSCFRLMNKRGVSRAAVLSLREIGH